ncbi:hypothetical protein EJ06DRAFT_481662 [Trichodelitschia bisporula]|uniref:Uncharacterized protein n=1 Tax=Trichodelitschia bisporula TaxID=703511 RepID=A0A6G1HNX8_9PEZI|nr:hypothetical protein EJ06DRAFT_481662 [Trichodelitschia bisporula]
MTRRIVYGMGLWATLAATALTLAAIILPRWLYWDNGDSDSPRLEYGLHKSCSTVRSGCTPFPRASECRTDPRFCSMWRTVGFFMSFTVMLELVALIAFVVVILGPKQRRDFGWKITCPLLGLAVATQVSCMAILIHLFNNHPRFIPGWHFDTSFTLCILSWIIELVAGAGIATAAYLLPEEGGYELIPGEYNYF